MKYLICVLLLALPCVAFAQSETPRYKQFPAEPYTGKPAPAKIQTKEARMFRTKITEGAQEGPNFAGHYTITTWGCGTGCVQFAIINAKTGDVFMPPFYIAGGMNVQQEKLQEEYPLQFKPDSKLLVVIGSRNEKGEGVYFYKWENDKLTLIHSAMELKQK